MEVLDPIAPGLGKDEFFERLQHDVEAATARLIAEGERELLKNGVRHASLGVVCLKDRPSGRSS